MWLDSTQFMFGPNPGDSVNTRVNSGQQQVNHGQRSTIRFGSDGSGQNMKRFG
ncbi:hypothetical protein HanPI659440_Chr10g0366271 [Helianthus annuus]|nr:hypothetical protein HanPI659440_Chr10g0366271 [Helianthus annuus]